MKGRQMDWTKWHYCYSSGDLWVIPVSGHELWLAATEEGEHIGSAPTMDLAMDLCAEYRKATSDAVPAFQARLRVALEPIAEDLSEDTQQVVAKRGRGRPANIWQTKKKGSRVWHALGSQPMSLTACGLDFSEVVKQEVKQQPKYVSCDKCIAAMAQPQLTLVG
jgi:hypothetical protein